MLKTLRKTKTALAMAAALGAVAMMPQGQAANIAPDGLSDVGFVPYYTVRNGWNTYIHLVNTTNRTAIIKARWREAYNSREVRDFNIILSPFDVWTGAITPNDTDTGGMVKTDDNSCTVPTLPDVGGGFSGVGFTSVAYDGTLTPPGVDGGPTSLDRTKEGYFEFFLMGLSLTEQPVNGYDEIANPFEWATEHDSTGVPNDCASVQDNVAFPSFDVGGAGINRNVIAANATLINVANGQSVGIQPTMIANCLVDDIYTPRDVQPTSEECLILTSTVLDDNLASGAPVGLVVTDDFASGQDAVSAAIQRATLINEWTTAAATNARTDWITTFPTKHHYTDGVGDGLGNADAPFSEQFNWLDPLTGLLRGQSCDPISITLYDREEQSREEDVPFSPFVPGQTTELCNEVNVITFNSSNVFGSAVPRNIDTSGVGDRGWASIGLGDPLVNTITGLANTFNGLPVIGTAVTVRNNPVVEVNNRNFASAHDHKYTRDVGAP